MGVVSDIGCVCVCFAGLMKSLVQIKLDLNHLVYLPDSIGK